MNRKPQIFVTGSTSKLGINFTVKMLEKTDAELWLLVRKLPHARDPWKRLELCLELQNSNLRLRNYSDRVHVVVGDIGKRNLGVSDSDFEILKNAGIREVFHLAALTERPNSTKENLLNVNYEGTSRLLRFSKILGVKIFNHLSWLYSSSENLGHNSGVENYLEFLDETDNFDEINEFVHRLTAASVISKSFELGLAFRIFESAYFVDLENHQKISGRWFYALCRSIFDAAYAYRKAGARPPTSIRFPATDASIFMTTPGVVADFLVAAYLEESSSIGQVYQIFNSKIAVQDFLKILSQEFPGINLQFTSDKSDMSFLERKLFSRSSRFLEYLRKYKKFMPDPKVHQMVEDHRILSPLFDENAFRSLAKTCLQMYRLDSEKTPLSLPLRAFLKAQFVSKKWSQKIANWRRAS